MIPRARRAWIGAQRRPSATIAIITATVLRSRNGPDLKEGPADFEYIAGGLREFEGMAL